MSMTRIHVTIDQSHIDWFNEKFQGAAISWWINLLMEKSREVMTDSPSDYARLAAEHLKENLRE